jgi:hypothetical protein
MLVIARLTRHCQQSLTGNQNIGFNTYRELIKYNHDKQKTMTIKNPKIAKPETSIDTPQSVRLTAETIESVSSDSTVTTTCHRKS